MVTLWDCPHKRKKSVVSWLIKKPWWCKVWEAFSRYPALDYIWTWKNLHNYLKFQKQMMFVCQLQRINFLLYLKICANATASQYCFTDVCFVTLSGVFEHHQPRHLIKEPVSL